MIKVYAIGNLTRDPEMRYTASGKAVTEFSVASNEGYGEKRTTEYVDVQCWDKLAESVAEHLVKGRQVFVEGRWKTDSWEDKNGQKRTKVRVIANNVEYLDRSARTTSRATTTTEESESLEGLRF